MLRIYPRMLKLARRLRPLIEEIARHDRYLADQVRRAYSSAVLNTAEGMGRRRGNRRLRYETAVGEAGETRSGLELAEAWGYVRRLDAEVMEELGAIICVLDRLAQPRH